jgi:hypothetical protein
MKKSELRQLIREEIKEIIQPNKNPNLISKKLKPEIDNFLISLEKEIEKSSKSTNEGILTTAGFVLAFPSILKLISKLGKKAGNLIGKQPEKESEYQEWMKKLGETADNLHSLYLIPIEKIINKFVKDKNKAKKISTLIFYLIIASMLVFSGIETIKAFQSKNFSLSILEAALTAIKSGEIRQFISRFL